MFCSRPATHHYTIIIAFGLFFSGGRRLVTLSQDCCRGRILFKPKTRLSIWIVDLSDDGKLALIGAVGELWLEEPTVGLGY